MQVTFQSPVASPIGKLEHKGKFYVRQMNGKFILQRRPNRKGHVPTANEKANQQRFIQCYRKTKKSTSACTISNEETEPSANNSTTS